VEGGEIVQKKLWKLFDMGYEPRTIAAVLNVPRFLVEKEYIKYQEEKAKVEKHRKKIIKGLYKDKGYRLDKVAHLDDGLQEVIMLIYVREKKC